MIEGTATFWYEIALVLLRVFLGLSLAAHGAQKLLGWFGGAGLKGTAGYFAKLGYRPAHLFAWAAALGEVGGGLLTATGLLGASGPAIMVGVMIVATAASLPNGYFAMTRGVELPLLYLVGGVFLSLTGPSRYSLDSLLGIQGISSPTLSGGILGLGVLAGILNLVLRKQPAE